MQYVLKFSILYKISNLSILFFLLVYFPALLTCAHDLISGGLPPRSGNGSGTSSNDLSSDPPPGYDELNVTSSEDDVVDESSSDFSTESDLLRQVQSNLGLGIILPILIPSLDRLFEVQLYVEVFRMLDKFSILSKRGRSSLYAGNELIPFTKASRSTSSARKRKLPEAKL